MECISCPSLAGKKRISPGPFIYEGKYWVIDHAYPTKLIGWVVIVLKRHAEKLHELTPDEFKELGVLQAKITNILFKELNCEKEYSVCFAEKEGFNHIHFHIIPKPTNLPDELKGPKIFSMLTSDENDAVSKEAVIILSQKLRTIFDKEFAAKEKL